MGQNINIAQKYFDNFEFDKAEKILLKTIDNNTDVTNAYCLLAKIYTRKQNYGAAINYYNKALELQPGNTDANTGIELIQNVLKLSNNFYFENPYTDDGLYE